MKKTVLKKFPTIACCGIDCGLCPTYYTKGPSKCPGCGGPNFSSKHPSCSILTCCTKNYGFETCADCNLYPCEKLNNWDKIDSFVTHKASLQNLYDIKQNGMKNFIEQQKSRIKILEILLNSFNDGRSKKNFCIATALLSLDDLNDCINKIIILMEEQDIGHNNIKSKANLMRDLLTNYAQNNNLELELRTYSKK